MHGFKTATLTTLLVILLAISAIPVTTASPPWREPEVPSAEEIFGWIEDLVEIGLEDGSEGRRPGTSAGWESVKYMRDKFEEFGLQDVGYDPPEGVNIFNFTVDDYGLTVYYDGSEESIDCYPVQYVDSTGPAGIMAPLVYVGSGTEEDFEATDVTDKIALVDVYYPWMPMFIMPWYYFDDPIDQAWYHAPLFSDYPSVYDRAVAHGALGWIGIFADQYYAHGGEKFQAIGSGADGSIGSIPALFIDKVDGAYLKDLVTSVPVDAHLLLDSRVEPSVDYNAVGVLPGKSDDLILLGAHWDSAFDGAVDNAVGCGVLLAVAKSLAQLPQASRDKTWMFLSQGAHEAAGLSGSGSFIDRHKDDILEKLVIYLNMDHLAAIETDPEQVGEENVGTRALTLCAVPDVPVFIDIITKAVVEYVPTKVMVAPDWGFWGTPGEPIWKDLGYRVCDFISGPSYYHTPDDTLDKIDPEQLVPHTKLYIEVVTALDDVPTNLIDTCPPLPTPIYYGIEPTPPIPRTLYVGCGSMKTDDKYKGKGALFETEDTIYLGVEESGWIAWDIVQQWEDTDVTIYECQSEWGTLWVYIYKELCLAKGRGTLFVGKDV